MGQGEGKERIEGQDCKCVMQYLKMVPLVANLSLCGCHFIYDFFYWLG